MHVNFQGFFSGAKKEIVNTVYCTPYKTRYTRLMKGKDTGERATSCSGWIEAGFIYFIFFFYRCGEVVQRAIMTVPTALLIINGNRVRIQKNWMWLFTSIKKWQKHNRNNKR